MTGGEPERAMWRSFRRWRIVEVLDRDPEKFVTLIRASEHHELWVNNANLRPLEDVELREPEEDR